MSLLRAAALPLLLFAFASGCDSMSMTSEEVIRLGPGTEDANMEIDGSGELPDEGEEQDEIPAL